MSTILKQLAQRELNSRRQSKVSIVDSILSDLSPVQRAFAEDKSRLVLARCTRRAGKSRSVAARIVGNCYTRKGYRVLYLGLTQQQAIDIISPHLEAITKKYGIPTEFFLSLKRYKFPNGSMVQVHGVDSANLIDRVRGQAFDLVVFDECAFARGLEQVIDVVLPALADTSGSMIMLSSPDLPIGFFYEADVGKYKEMWGRHFWTMHDNPLYAGPATNPKYKTRAEEEIDTVLQLRYGGNKQHPAFRREWLGEWYADVSRLVYPYSHKNKLPIIIDMEKRETALGLDLGVKADNAIVAMNYSQYSREVQFVETWKKNEVVVDELAQMLRYFMDKYSTDTIVADTGGLGAAVVQELTKRYNIPIIAADKRDKAFYQRIFANDLYAEYIKVLDLCADLTGEWDKLVKNDHGEEMDGIANHLSDAALYVYRRVYTMHLKHFEKPKTTEELLIQNVVESAYEERENELEFGNY